MSGNSIVQCYADLVTGFGLLAFIFKIQLKENGYPTPLRDQVKKELEMITMLRVNKKLEEPTVGLPHW